MCKWAEIIVFKLPLASLSKKLFKFMLNVPRQFWDVFPPYMPFALFQEWRNQWILRLGEALYYTKFWTHYQGHCFYFLFAAYSTINMSIFSLDD